MRPLILRGIELAHWESSLNDPLLAPILDASDMNALQQELAAVIAPLVEKIERLEAKIDAQTDPEPPWVTPREAAELARCSVDTIRRWVQEGKVESKRGPGNKLLIKREEL